VPGQRGAVASGTTYGRRLGPRFCAALFASEGGSVSVTLGSGRSGGTSSQGQIFSCAANRSSRPNPDPTRTHLSTRKASIPLMLPAGGGTANTGRPAGLATAAPGDYADAMSGTSRRNPHRVIGLGLLLLTLSLPGCARKNEVVLHQPLAPPSQQTLKLAGDWAFHAGDGQRDAYALAFPLPGSIGGPRAFVIYISVPDRGNLQVDPLAPDGVKGFFVQELGALSGRSDFVSGSLRSRPVLFAPRFRRLDLNIRCDDGTEITGQAVVEEVPRQVWAFEREFAADIASLSAAITQSPAAPGELADQPKAVDGTAPATP
jgi:hypothetical protein